jgi:lipopolysaccharide transport system ATP-binding protein
MNNYSIKINKLSKKYKKGKQSYQTLRDFISFKSLFTKRNSNDEYFFALKDINLKINKGEVIGIIGKNGSGKSTLLKILSRIVEPTTGEIIINGKVSSLLEVGTGFNLELSGRENIYLNGSILGLSKKKIDKYFKKIVDFSGISEFIDLPAKKYSSGMLVRLAFSVASFLEAEILLIDEVLAVGDQEFREKSVKKMSQIVKSGRTVLFVSHNLNVVKNLCSKVILLDKGKIKKVGDPVEVINLYLNGNKKTKKEEIKNKLKNLGIDKDIEIKNISIKQNNLENEKLENSEKITLEVSFLLKNKTSNLRIYFDLITKDGNLIFRSFNDEIKKTNYKTNTTYISKAILPANLFSPGEYYLDIKATIFNERSCFDGNSIKIPLSIIHTSLYNKNYPNDPIRGLVAPVINWETK